MSQNSSEKSLVEETLSTHGQSLYKRRIKHWFIIIVLLGILTAFFFQFSGKPDTVEEYKTANSRLGDMTVTISATGTLQPVNQVQLGSEISGLIDEVLVDYNDLVKKDQVLAKINTDQLTSKIEQSQAALLLSDARLNEAETTLAETEARWKRMQALEKEAMCSPEECDAAKASYLRAKASVASARAQQVQSKAQLQSDKTLLEKAMIRAPISGIVLSRNVEPGQTVAASFQTPVLFTLAEDLTHMELHVDIDEADVGQVAAGQKARFSVDAYPQKQFNAQITKVHYAPKVVQDVVTYEALLSVNNSGMLLRPGMTASAEIVTQQIRDAILVPNTALRFNPFNNQTKARKAQNSVLRSILPGPPRQPEKQRKGKSEDDSPKVWVLKDGVPVSISVTTGATNGRMTQILSGDVKPDMELLVDIVRIKK